MQHLKRTFTYLLTYLLTYLHKHIHQQPQMYMNSCKYHFSFTPSRLISLPHIFQKDHG